jgi:hypothetical protein
MTLRSKLKGPIGRIYPIAILSTYVLGVIEFFIRRHLDESLPDISWGPFYSTILLSLFFVFMGIYQWRRYRLWVYPVVNFLAATSTFQSLSNYHIYNLPYLSLEAYIINILVIVLFIVFYWPTFSGAEKFEANARRLFKLAGELLHDTSDGFTERPYTAGSVSYIPEDLMGFVRFINGRFIAKSFHRGSSIYLGFSLGKSMVVTENPEEVSYIKFDQNGSITVSISAFDYHQYRKSFSFDQLCASVGDIFKRFLEYYKDGNEARIIAELKMAR